jgi:hypothetical protein
MNIGNNLHENTIRKMAVFMDVALCSLVYTDQRFRCSNCLHHQGDHLSDYAAQHSRRYPDKSKKIEVH